MPLDIALDKNNTTITQTLLNSLLPDLNGEKVEKDLTTLEECSVTVQSKTEPHKLPSIQIDSVEAVSSSVNGLLNNFFLCCSS